MGQAYTLHTPEAVGVALRCGLNAVEHPYQAGPFYLLMPMNTQCRLVERFNLEELPVGAPPGPGAACGDYAAAVDALLGSSRVVVKVGGGARQAGPELAEFLELADAVAVTSPLVSGVLPYDHPRNMTVGGSKGSLCGNFAMDEADCLVVLGSRSVCQADSSRTGYPKVESVINVNADAQAATHYNKTTALVGDVRATLAELNDELRQSGADSTESDWFRMCSGKKREWDAFKAGRYNSPCLHDDAWKREVLTQPAAIKTALDWADRNQAVSFFDAGDVQANGLQAVEDSRLGQTFTETGASYMGFAANALMATALTEEPFYGLAFSGDGSFTMSPQILIDGVEHGARGCVLLFDNRNMGAITGLQLAQYGAAYATSDSVEVDYVAWANAIKGVAGFCGGHSTEELVAALDQARSHDGVSLIHVPVYCGSDELGGLGAFGRWNVGNWCDDVQALRHEIGL